jgi:hypothetical protein
MPVCKQQGGAGMKRYLLVCLVALVAFIAAACDSLSTDPGSFVVVFQWETGHEPDTAAKDYYIWVYYQEWKGGEGKTFPADIESNAKSLDEEVDPAALTFNWNGLAFVLADNRADCKSLIFSHNAMK